MRAFCITLPEKPILTNKAERHFKERGLSVDFFCGLSADVAGLSTVHTYELDNPGSGFRIGTKPTGIWISHWILLSALNLLPDKHFLVLETDANFHDDWNIRTAQALKDVPVDFDFLLIGSCCCAGKPQKHVKGEIFEVNWPLCTHAYIISKKCIPFVLKTLRRIWAPIDIQLSLEVYPYLKTYTLLPRAVDQFDTVISP
jgi:hypothetical protein